MSLPPPPPPPRLSQGLFPWHRGRPRPDLGVFLGFSLVFGVFLACQPCPWPSPRPPAGAADGAAGPVWCDRVGGDRWPGGTRGGSPWVRGPAALPVSPAGVTCPRGWRLRAQNGRERQGSVPVWLCCRGCDGEGAFAGLYQEGTGLSPARGDAGRGVRPLAGPARGQRPAPLRVPYSHSLSLRWETAQPHTHRHTEVPGSIREI